jgi:hypothetical protein
MPDYNPTHPAMDSVQVTLFPSSYTNTVSLTTGLTLNWNIVGDRLDFQAVYSGVAWCVAGVEWDRAVECVGTVLWMVCLCGADWMAERQ